MKFDCHFWSKFQLKCVQSWIKNGVQILFLEINYVSIAMFIETRLNQLHFLLNCNCFPLFSLTTLNAIFRLISKITIQEGFLIFVADSANSFTSFLHIRIIFFIGALPLSFGWRGCYSFAVITADFHLVSLWFWDWQWVK